MLRAKLPNGLATPTPDIRGPGAAPLAVNPCAAALSARPCRQSPGFDEGPSPFPPRCWYNDPPASNGTKVIITDTDHFAPGMGDALWAWKAFLRGQNPILMDFGLIDGPTATDGPGYQQFEKGRFAMGIRAATQDASI